MAEGFLRHLAGDQFEVLSAGTHPQGLNPLAVRVMREIGIDISGQRSKDVSEYLGQDLSWVVTVCDRAKETCPVFSSSAKRLHWSLNDPAEAEGAEEDRLAVFRRVRDEIASHIRDFIARRA
jgi:arsenate reductase